MNGSAEYWPRVVDGPAPAFRAVITGTCPCLTLDDGTVTFPLAAFRP